MSRGDTIYLAGPMREYEKYNFPAFEEATHELQDRGFIVISPHQLDLDNGFDPSKEWTKNMLRAAVERDVEAILEVDAVVLLPNWEKSTGARAEKALAEWLQKPIYLYPCMTHVC